MSLPNHIIARLGTTSDAALAAEAGVPTHRIRYARAMRGIPSTRGSGPAWLSLRVIHDGRLTTLGALLGEVDSVTIAALAGVSPQRVRQVRQERGIDAPDKPRSSVVLAE